MRNETTTRPAPAQLITRTESYSIGEVVKGIHIMEDADWNVRQIVPFAQGAMLVVFEREAP